MVSDATGFTSSTETAVFLANYTLSAHLRNYSRTDCEKDKSFFRSDVFS